MVSPNVHLLVAFVIFSPELVTTSTTTYTETAPRPAMFEPGVAESQVARLDIYRVGSIGFVVIQKHCNPFAAYWPKTASSSEESGGWSFS